MGSTEEMEFFMKVSLVIPVRNEEKNLLFVLDKVPDDIFEIIIVDGNSSDGTVAFAKSHPRKPTVLRQKSRGKGAALSAGFAAATGDLVAIIDADGSMDPGEIALFLSGFPSADIVKGSRYLNGGGSSDLTIIRSSGNRILTKIANVLFKQSWTDMAYGFAVFKREILEDLALTNYDKLGSLFGHKSYGQGFEIETLMFTRAARRNLLLVEVPSYEYDRISGASNLRAIRDGFRVLFALIIERARYVDFSGPEKE
jgi:glycosyltransferase involved in cell wall biosynthesis